MSQEDPRILAAEEQQRVEDAQSKIEKGEVKKLGEKIQELVVKSGVEAVSEQEVKEEDPAKPSSDSQ